MTASFPWYDLPHVRWANDVIWQAACPEGPPLDRATPHEVQWRSTSLVISQSCGLDLFVGNAPIEPVLAPNFELADCRQAHYFSYLISRPGRGCAAINSLTSHSGCTALLKLTSPRACLLTGSHRASIDAVRRGDADFASIDAVTWHLLERGEPDLLDGIERVDRSESSPAPPYVVRNGTDSDIALRLERALRAGATRAARAALLMAGVEPVGRADYLRTYADYSRVRDSGKLSSLRVLNAESWLQPVHRPA